MAFQLLPLLFGALAGAGLNRKEDPLKGALLGGLLGGFGGNALAAKGAETAAQSAAPTLFQTASGVVPQQSVALNSLAQTAGKGAIKKGLSEKALLSLGANMLSPQEQAAPVSVSPAPLTSSFQPVASTRERIERSGGNEPLFVSRPLFEEIKGNLDEEELLQELLRMRLQNG